MSNITIELNDEETDNIVVDKLFETRSALLQDYDRVNARVFSVDPKEDRKQIRKMIRSLERVIEWYTVPGSVVFDKLEK